MAQELSQLKDRIIRAGQIPRHIAIIMDGNGGGPGREDCLASPGTTRASTAFGRWFAPAAS